MIGTRVVIFKGGMVNYCGSHSNLVLCTWCFVLGAWYLVLGAWYLVLCSVADMHVNRK